MPAAFPKTLLITGVSSGLGRAFAVGALDAGHRVMTLSVAILAGGLATRLGPITETIPKALLAK